MCNQNCYDGLQIHGGSGYMKEYPIQRYYRDARITSIYEGTTQLQVVAATRYVTSGVYLALCREMEEQPVTPDVRPYQERSRRMADLLEQATQKVKDATIPGALDHMARRLYEMAALCVMSHLLQYNASQRPDLFAQSLETFMDYAEAELAKHFTIIGRL